jgi:hypothetical protein
VTSLDADLSDGVGNAAALRKVHVDLAELLECSEGAVVRDALEVYGLHKRIVTAQETARKRRLRAAAKRQEKEEVSDD